MRNEIHRDAQWHIAEAMLSFHQQLAAAFRGDLAAARAAHERATFFTAEAIKCANKLLGRSPIEQAKEWLEDE